MYSNNRSSYSIDPNISGSNNEGNKSRSNDNSNSLSSGILSGAGQELSNFTVDQCILVDKNSINAKTSLEEGLPHLVLHRLWVDSSVECQNMLESICTFGFESNHTQYCINPHHYRKKLMIKNLELSMMPQSSETPLASMPLGNENRAVFDQQMNPAQYFKANNPSDSAEIATRHVQRGEKKLLPQTTRSATTSSSSYLPGAKSKQLSNLSFSGLHQIAPGQIVYTVFYFEKDCQVGPTFEIAPERFSLNGYFRSCWSESLMTTSHASISAISNGILSIGGLVGLRADAKSQITKMRLNNGIHFRIVNKIIDEKIYDRYVAIENQSNLKLHLKFVDFSQKLSIRQLKVSECFKFITVKPKETLSVFSYKDFEETLLSFTLDGYENYLDAIEKITKVDISLDQCWVMHTSAKSSPKSSDIKMQGKNCDEREEKLDKIEHTSQEELEEFPNSWLRVRFNMFNSIIDKILEKYHTCELNTA
ncbi:MAG: Mothers against decapentaplegic 9 [Marteilia pararefringens]